MSTQTSHRIQLTSAEQDAFTRRHADLTRRLASRHMYAAAYLDRPDVESDAWMGLARAAATYDPTAGATEKGWVTKCVDWAVADGYQSRFGDNDSPHRRPFEMALRRAVRLDRPLTDGTGTTWAELLPDGTDFVDDLVTRAVADEGFAALMRFIDQLEPRQAEALTATYLGGRLLQDVADDWGVSEARVSQVRRAALRHLRLLLGVTERRVTKAHGTQAAYVAHRKRGEKACEPCRLANNENSRVGKRRRRLKAAA